MEGGRLELPRHRPAVSALGGAISLAPPKPAGERSGHGSSAATQH